MKQTINVDLSGNIININGSIVDTYTKFITTTSLVRSVLHEVDKSEITNYSYKSKVVKSKIPFDLNKRYTLLELVSKLEMLWYHAVQCEEEFLFEEIEKMSLVSTSFFSHLQFTDLNQTNIEDARDLISKMGNCKLTKIIVDSDFYSGWDLKRLLLPASTLTASSNGYIGEDKGIQFYTDIFRQYYSITQSSTLPTAFAFGNNSGLYNIEEPRITHAQGYLEYEQDLYLALDDSRITTLNKV